MAGVLKKPPEAPSIIEDISVTTRLDARWPPWLVFMALVTSLDEDTCQATCRKCRLFISSSLTIYRYIEITRILYIKYWYLFDIRTVFFLIVNRFCLVPCACSCSVYLWENNVDIFILARKEDESKT